MWDPKNLAIPFTGELHKVRLINFSVPLAAVQDKVPKGLKIRTLNGRALISMVDVRLKKMSPEIMPLIRFGYRHVGFRLLLDDREFNGTDQAKGIYFIDSFTDQPLIAWGGSTTTHFRLHQAQLLELQDGLHLHLGDKWLHYQLEKDAPVWPQDDLKKEVATLDRAYCKMGTEDGETVFGVTRITRKSWPIKQIACAHFATNFFEDAQFEAAFEIEETIPYRWEPLTRVQTKTVLS